MGGNRFRWSSIVKLALVCLISTVVIGGWFGLAKSPPKKQAPGRALTPEPIAAVDPGVESWEAFDRFEDQIAKAIAKVQASTVALEYTESNPSSANAGKVRRLATGIVLNHEGDLLSVGIDRPSPGSQIVARDLHGKDRATQWLADDADTGLTLLRVAQTEGLAPLKKSDQGPALGMSVFVIGNAFGLGHSVSRGHIAGLDRRLAIGSHKLGRLIQVDVPLRPGDNGALLANARGEWIGQIRGVVSYPGSNTAENPDQEHSTGVGFAIPAEDALWVAQQLRTHQSIERAYLGIRLFSDSSDRELPGALLSEILPAGPAAAAGLKPGDRILAFHDRSIETPDSLLDLLDRTLADQEVEVAYDRDGRLGRALLRTAARPQRGESGLAVVSSSEKIGDSGSKNPKPANSGDESQPPSASTTTATQESRSRDLLDRVLRLEQDFATFQHPPSQSLATPKP